MLRRSLSLVALALASAPAFAAADEPVRELHLTPLPDADTIDRKPAERRDPPDESPKHAFVESPFNLSSGALYAGVTGTAIGGSGTSEAQGGVVIGGSPIDRLSIHGFVGRDNENKWAPIVSLHLRLLGSLADGYALGALVQYKTDGFADVGGEVETGVTFGVRHARFYLDSNVIAGFSSDPEEGEADGEARLRLGYAIVDAFRLGAEGQVRHRLHGVALAGGRSSDFAAGPQAVAFLGPVVLSATGGATSTDITRGTGGFGLVTVGAFAR